MTPNGGAIRQRIGRGAQEHLLVAEMAPNASGTTLSKGNVKANSLPQLHSVRTDFQSTESQWRSTATVSSSQRWPATQDSWRNEPGQGKFWSTSTGFLPASSGKLPPLGTTTISWPPWPPCKGGQAAQALKSISLWERSASKGAPESRRVLPATLAMRPLVGVDRKGSQISALSVDKQYVQQRMAANLESRSEHERRELPVENHWLAIMFQPIPCPQMFVPDYLKDRLPQAPIQKVMPALSIETTIVWSPRKSIPAKREASSGQSSPARSVGKAANLEHLADLLEKDELDLVMTVCSLFNELVARRVADNGTEILTRGAFCRMICVMGGLAVNGGRTMLMKAVARYDKLAASHSVKERGAAKGSRGTVTGLQISCSGGQLPHDLPVGTLFAQLLQDIADSFLLQMETSSRTRSESTLSRSESILRLEDSLYVFAMQSAKNLLFNGLLRDAEDFAKQRLEWIKQQIQKLMPEPEEPPKTAVSQDPSLPAPSVATSRRTSLAQSVRPPSKASSMNRQSIRLPVSPWTPPSERAMSSTERAVSVYSD